VEKIMGKLAISEMVLFDEPISGGQPEELQMSSGSEYPQILSLQNNE